MKCRFEGCQRARAYADQPFCADHRLRWAPSEPVAHEPEWLRRQRENALPAKDFTGSVA